MNIVVQREFMSLTGVIHQRKYPQRVNSISGSLQFEPLVVMLLSGLADGVVYVLTIPIYEDGGNDATNVESSKELWDSLEAKYMAEDASSKKFLVSCIIDKLPPSWKDFKHTLKHLKEELTLVELGRHLRIEESLRVQDNDKPKGNNVVGPLVVNMVEHKNSSRYNDNKGATVHVCKDRCWFKTYESLNDGSILYMGNESTALVHGRGCVDLKFSSWKIVSLFNVLHVPNIRKNLVSSSVLNNYGYKQVIESTKFVLSKHGVFIGFGYLSNHMFRLNIINDNIGSAFMSTFKLNDSILWHARLGHVHFKRMQDMSKDGLILAFYMHTKKCKTCMLTKITKKLFQNVKRETEVLDLIHCDLCDLHATPSLGNKKLFVTFIDDASRAVVRLLDPKLKTLGERGIECIFVENAENSKAFRFYVIEPNDSVSINSIIESRDAIFDENRFSSVPRSSLRIPNGTKDTGGSVVPEEVTEEDDPKTFDEAMKSQDVAFWKEAINDEMDSIMGNNTWVLADLPPGCKPLVCKWILKRKLKVDRTIEKFKARLVIQGFKQKSWIDYFDTYAPMDVKTTFLNGELDEEHAPKQWHQKFDEVVLSNGYLLNQADKCVFSKFDETGHGDADAILCIMIKHESNGIEVSQSHYIEKVLKKFNYFNCTPVSTPIDTSEKLMPNNGQVVSQLEYSRYTSNHDTQHWQAIQTVLKYLNKTIDYGLMYTGYPSVLKGYTDAR
ncbi:zinc finger, CCHC-type containing protein [Tanacetum coccineum]